MFIHLPTGALGVVGFGLAFGYVEGGARDDDVGGVGCSGPFLRERAWVSKGCEAVREGKRQEEIKERERKGK